MSGTAVRPDDFPASLGIDELYLVYDPLRERCVTQIVDRAAKVSPVQVEGEFRRRQAEKTGRPRSRSTTSSPTPAQLLDVPAAASYVGARIYSALLDVGDLGVGRPPAVP